MTLDFKKLILNAVRKQMAIQHFSTNGQIFKKEELPERVMAKIGETFGEDFMGDANYTLWFSGQGLTKEIVQKTIFKIANKAMGEAANSMNDSDLKMIDLGTGGGNAETPSRTPDDMTSMSDPSADDANAQAVGDLMGSPSDGDDDADEMDDLDESVEEPSEGEKFCFIKITMK